MLWMKCNAYAKLNNKSNSKWTKQLLKSSMKQEPIRIKGKNVNNLDLEKIANLIQQANEKSSNTKLKRLFKSLKKSRPDNSQQQ